MAAIIWTAEAERWLKNIYEFIREDNPVAAGKVVDGIYEKVGLLETFPQLGHRYETDTSQDIRVLLYGHYRIAYLLTPEEQIVILGIFHSALNIERYL